VVEDDPRVTRQLGRLGSPRSRGGAAVRVELGVAASRVLVVSLIAIDARRARVRRVERRPDALAAGRVVDALDLVSAVAVVAHAA